VVFNGISARAIKETPDQALFQGPTGSVSGKVRMLILKTGALPGLAANSLVVVGEVGDEETFKVIAVQDADDGKLTHAFITAP
jgi:hypothetical protein